MDHDRKVCPRCGEPTAGYGFCPPCRAHIDSLTGGPSGAPDVSSTAQVLREVVRLEQALADASQGMSDRIGAGSSTTALEVDSAPESLTEEPSSGSRDIAKLPTSGEEVPPRPDVARLEDVLTVLPRSEDRPIAPTPEATSVVPPEPASVAPPEPPAPAELTSVAPPEAQVRAEPLAATNLSYVAAHVLRAAFWFEQTSAFESRPDDDLPEFDADLRAATSVPPPDSAPTPISAPPPPQAEPLPAAEAETAQRNWITALCLLALITLVVVLTGRRPCRCDCHKSR